MDTVSAGVGCFFCPLQAVGSAERDGVTVGVCDSHSSRVMDEGWTFRPYGRTVHTAYLDEDVLRELRVSRQLIREVLRDITVSYWEAADGVARDAVATEVFLWGDQS